MSLLSIADPARFIRAETRILAPPHVPELCLHLADEAVTLWHRTEEELGELGLPPPFWAFAWAGGQALARFILDQPAVIAGKSVLDFASGSGLVGIAAMKAGAASVLAAEIDSFAVEAIRLNTALNDVTLAIESADLVGEDRGWDVVLAGDVCYQRDMAERVFCWLRSLHRRGATVLIGDPGRSYLPKAELEAIATYRVPVTRAIEDHDVKETRVWRLVDPAPA